MTSRTLLSRPGGIFATIALAMLVKVEDNRRAVLLMHLGIMFGAVLLLATTLGYSNAGLDPMLWVTVSTCGLMLMYTPTGSFLYDRLMAASGTPGTTSFLVFLSDGLGYIAVVAILLAKTFAASDDANGGNVESVGLDWNDSSSSSSSSSSSAAADEASDDVGGHKSIAALFVKLTYGLSIFVFLLILPTTAWLQRNIPSSRLRRDNADLMELDDLRGGVHHDES